MTSPIGHTKNLSSLATPDTSTQQCALPHQVQGRPVISWHDDGVQQTKVTPFFNKLICFQALWLEDGRSQVTFETYLFILKVFSL